MFLTKKNYILLFFNNNKSMKQLFHKILLLFLLMVFVLPTSFLYASATDGLPDEKFYIYDEMGNYLTDKSNVSEGDTILTSDYYEYKITSIEGRNAYASVVKKVLRPAIRLSSTSTNLNNKKICLYMTHNDESYLPSDGYDSIYGAGGIHDVALSLQKSLQTKGIVTILDQTLHIPHDSSAYTRSKVTATNLKSTYSPDALFDIHRDGVAKSYYETTCNGKQMSKIRIVVGKGNSNYQENYAFASKIFALGQAMYPGLFLDIYSGKGTYNQNLQEQALLFEMGTYLIEKEAVLDSVPLLANVINTALYASEENGDEIIVDEEIIDELEKDYVEGNNSNLSGNSSVQNQSKNNGSKIGLWIFFGLMGTGIVALTIIAIYKKNKVKI